jgi:BirA family biotin operon repressor/biotin-[acetyl-CoA-carboxylase] ligase
LRASEFPAEVVGEVLQYGGFIGSCIECHDVLKRAMTYGQNLIYHTQQSGKPIPSGTVIFAEKLSKSKGRFDRSWHAPEGGLWGCLILTNTFSSHTRLLLPLAVGVACCEAVRESGAHDCTIRWVNDVLLGKLKLAGFLIEIHTSQLGGEAFYLVGFGINLNNRSFPEELENLAVSLYEIIGKRVYFGYNVIDHPLYEATVTGINKDGGLMMRFDDGSNAVEYSGEIRYLEQ